MKIFLSHIHEERRIAAVIKDWLESTTSGQCEVWASSDVKDNPGGNKWLAAIHSQLSQSDLLLVLYSQTSMPRPWINFEVGAAWLKGIPVLPLLHSGLSPADLKQPIAEFNSLTVEHASFAQSFFDTLYLHAKLLKKPRIDEGKFTAELILAIDETKAEAKTTQSQSRIFEPQELQRRILRECLEALNTKRIGLDEGELAIRLGVTIAIVLVNMSKLLQEGLVLKGLVMFQGAYVENTCYYRLSQKGIEACVESASTAA